MNEAFKIGDIIPNFTLPADNGDEISLSNFHNKKIVIYFYPKDDTPGCTIEAKDFSCLIEEFANHNTIIIGISKDNIKKHQKFKEKHDLKHILLSDEDGKICDIFGCWVEKSMYGKKYMGIARRTFLLDNERRIIKIWPEVKISGHAEEVLACVRG